jgi:hypothetical protein
MAAGSPRLLCLEDCSLFKSLRNRMWLLGVAQHEYRRRMLREDTLAIKRDMTAFEREMRARGSWPFGSIEELALAFGAWLPVSHGSQEHAGGARREPSMATQSQMPWTDTQWRLFANAIPQQISKLLSAHSRQPADLQTDDWFLGYVFGYVGAWMGTMPERLLEQAAPELTRAAFKGLLGDEGSAAFSRCMTSLRQDGPARAGKSAGGLDGQGSIAAARDGSACGPGSALSNHLA